MRGDEIVQMGGAVPLRRRLSPARPLSYLDGRLVRLFQRALGPVYPPYLGLAILWGFFSFLSFFAIGFQVLALIPLVVAGTIRTGTGLLLYFADDTIVPIPADLTLEEFAAVRRRMKLASLLIVLGSFAVLGSYFLLGALGFYTTVGFLMLGFTTSSLWTLATTRALPCSTCGAVTLFRAYRGRFVCTRCGNGP